MKYTGTPFDLTGRVALITGGSKGLGLAMTRIFVEAGADVFLCSRHGGELEAAAASLRDVASARVEWMQADMTDRVQVKQLAGTALERMGRVDILVNNAGANVPQRIDEVTDETWDEFLELNLSSAMRLTRALAPQMIERKWGRIIHITSILGFTSIAGRSTYSASKAGLLGLARAGALDLGTSGITVNCIAPGPFLTDLPGRVLSEEDKGRFAARTALHRWGRPEEISGAALLLASEAGSYITGSTLIVDGGALTRML
jgi:NAD(P)-dependent dehydrogenase (short-subunit alcohol dehydrogenase family)